MVTARHPRPSELSNATLEEIEQKYVAQFRNRVSDWEAFEDAKVEGFKRAQHRFIGAGGSGKVGDDSVIPARGFTLTIMFRSEETTSEHQSLMTNSYAVLYLQQK